MRKLFAFAMILMLAFSAFGQTANPGVTPRWDKLMDYVQNGQYTMTYKTLTSPTFTGTLEAPSLTNAAAGGDKGLNLAITQTTAALTGNLIAGAFVATNGAIASANGTIYGLEVKSRAATSGNVGHTIGRLDGVYASVDAKNKEATIMRAFEASLDGGAGGTSTEAVAFEAFNNSSATQTASYAFSANGGTASGHKAYTADFRMQNGELIDNATDGHTGIGGVVDFYGAGTKVATAGLLHGAGATNQAGAFSVGATGGKAMSYYLKTTSSTTTHALEGLYIRTYYGVDATSAAPMGEAGRFFASLVGDALNGTITGVHATAGVGTGATNGGLTVGSRSNLSLPNEAYTIGSAGTFAGAQVEINSGGSSTDPTASKTSVLRLVIDGTITDTKWASVPLFDIVVPASLVSNSSYLVDLDASDATVGAKLRIMINGVPYWIMLADASN